MLSSNIVPLDLLRESTVPEEIVGRFFFDPESQLPEPLQDLESILERVSQKFRSKPTATILEEIDLAVLFLRKSSDFATAKILEDGLMEWEPLRLSKPDIFRKEILTSIALAIHAVETSPLQARLDRRASFASAILMQNAEKPLHI